MNILFNLQESTLPGDSFKQIHDQKAGHLVLATLDLLIQVHKNIKLYVRYVPVNMHTAVMLLPLFRADPKEM